jgi:hemerythrin superfamily protein
LGLGESIKRDHDAYRRFFAKMAKTTEKDGAARVSALKDIICQIYAHHKAEEVTVFPAMMKNAQLRGLAFELIVEHEDMKRLFEALKDDKADVEVWKYKLSSIYDIMHAHWLKEEEQLTPFGLDYFSEAKWRDFGARFDQVLVEELNMPMMDKKP